MIAKVFPVSSRTMLCIRILLRCYGYSAHFNIDPQRMARQRQARQAQYFQILASSVAPSDRESVILNRARGMTSDGSGMTGDKIQRSTHTAGKKSRRTRVMTAICSVHNFFISIISIWHRDTCHYATGRYLGSRRRFVSRAIPL